MNFEFLKNLRGLSHIYADCADAEKLLAMNMPRQSLFTSRRSAELLAKFIYMAAHEQQLSGMSFADILADPAVRAFIHNRGVMNAFHAIRRSGNSAVHGTENHSGDEAMDTLQNLHYIAGEIACLLELIADYPPFEDELVASAEELTTDTREIGVKALQMFTDYVEAFHAAQERERYVEQEDYDILEYTLEGTVDMHEFLAFDRRPRQAAVIRYVQDYLCALVRLSDECTAWDPLEASGLSLRIILTTDNHTVTSDERAAFSDALTHRLPAAERFTVDCTCQGNLCEFFHDIDENGEPVGDNPRLNRILKDALWNGAGMLDYLESKKRHEAFVYKQFIEYYDSGDCRFAKIANGKDTDVWSGSDDALLSRDCSADWWIPVQTALCVWFDYKQHPAVLAALQDVVRTHLPADLYEYCVSVWEDDDPCILVGDVGWSVPCMQSVQRFLDDINAVLATADIDATYQTDGYWAIPKQFALAAWESTPNGFRLRTVSY